MLQVQEVCCRFGGLLALDNVSLTINKGELVGLMGPNGAGKTTLFNIITGFISPAKGQVYLKGKEITTLPPHLIAKEGLARTFQDARVFEHLNVIQNVEVAVNERKNTGFLGGLLSFSGKLQIREFIRKEAMESLKLVGMEDFSSKNAISLTFGQQRLLGIARALASDPQMLLLDEPSAGLNQDETRALSETIRTICKKGVTVFIIEHDIDMLMSLAERIVVLDRGRKIMEGTPRQVRDEKMVVDAYFGRRRECPVCR